MSADIGIEEVHERLAHLAGRPGSTPVPPSIKLRAGEVVVDRSGVQRHGSGADLEEVVATAETLGLPVEGRRVATARLGEATSVHLAYERSATGLRCKLYLESLHGFRAADIVPAPWQMLTHIALKWVPGAQAGLTTTLYFRPDLPTGEESDWAVGCLPAGSDLFGRIARWVADAAASPGFGRRPTDLLEAVDVATLRRSIDVLVAPLGLTLSGAVPDPAALAAETGAPREKVESAVTVLGDRVLLRVGAGTHDAGGGFLTLYVDDRPTNHAVGQEK